MNARIRESMKHRLIGITVIVAVFAIFIPILFKPNSMVLADLAASRFSPSVPPEPFLSDPAQLTGLVSSLSSLADKKSRVTLADGQSGNRQSIVSKSTPALKKLSPTNISRGSHYADNVSTGWIIQLASFTNAENANKLVIQLRAEGYPAFTTTATNTAGKLVNRVLIGPESQREKASTLIPALERSTHLKGIVIQHNPL